MTTLEPHPLSKMFPPITEEDFDKLAADIKLNGLHQSTVRYQGKILDGNNRYRACELVKIAPKFADFTGDDAAARNYVISANIHRRHLSPDQRREMIAALLKAEPTRSDRQIAATARVDNKTVAAVRGQMEATEEIPQLLTRTGADGKTRAAKGKGKSKSTSGKEKLEYQKPIDTKTAISACRVLTEHLKDVLEDLSEFSSVDHAEVLAEQIKGEIDKTILHMKSQDKEENKEQVAV